MISCALTRLSFSSISIDLVGRDADYSLIQNKISLLLCLSSLARVKMARLKGERKALNRDWFLLLSFLPEIWNQQVGCPGVEPLPLASAKTHILIGKRHMVFRSERTMFRHTCLFLDDNRSQSSFSFPASLPAPLCVSLTLWVPTPIQVQEALVSFSFQLGYSGIFSQLV